MPGAPEIRHGIARQVNVSVRRPFRKAKWIAEFSLNGENVFFRGGDVNVSQTNRPEVCQDGDEVVVAGHTSVAGLWSSQPSFEAEVVRVIGTGRMIGSNGIGAIIFGGLLLAIGASLMLGSLLALLSGGISTFVGHINMLYVAVATLFVGVILMGTGVPARAKWQAVKFAV